MCKHTCSCGAVFTIPEDHLGKPLACNRCGTRFVMPAPRKGSPPKRVSSPAPSEIHHPPARARSAVDNDHSPTGIGARFGALIIDIIVAFSVTLIAAPLLLDVIQEQTVQLAGETLTYEGQILLTFGILASVLVILTLCVLALYSTIFESFPQLHATLGKLILQSRVMSSGNGGPSFIAATVRNIAKVFSLAMFGVPFIVGLLGKQKRTLHDYLSGTQVQAWRRSETAGRVIQLGLLVALAAALIFDAKFLSQFLSRESQIASTKLSYFPAVGEDVMIGDLLERYSNQQVEWSVQKKPLGLFDVTPDPADYTTAEFLDPTSRKPVKLLFRETPPLGLAHVYEDDSEISVDAFIGAMALTVLNKELETAQQSGPNGRLEVNSLYSLSKEIIAASSVANLNAAATSTASYDSLIASQEAIRIPAGTPVRVVGFEGSDYVEVTIGSAERLYVTHSAWLLDYAGSKVIDYQNSDRDVGQIEVDAVYTLAAPLVMAQSEGVLRRMNLVSTTTYENDETLNRLLTTGVAVRLETGAKVKVTGVKDDVVSIIKSNGGSIYYTYTDWLKDSAESKVAHY